MQSGTRRIGIGAFAVLATIVPLQAQAQTGWTPKSGQIRSVGLSEGGNYALRVFLSANGVDQLTGCTGNFAFIEVADSNYQAKSASLLTAAAAKKNVTLWVTTDANSSCKIMYFTVDFS